MTAKIKLSSPLIYALMLVLGALTGLFDIPVLKQAGQILSEIFVRLFQCVSLPVISLSLIVTLLNYDSDKKMNAIWQQTLKYTLVTTLIAATISFLLYLLIQPSSISTTAPLAKVHQTQSYWQYLTDLVPQNFFDPFIKHQVITVLFLSFAFGLAIKQIPDPAGRQAVANFFRGIHGMLMVLTSWIVAVIPLGLFGFISTTVTEIQHSAALKGLIQYLAVIVLANLIQGLVVLPLWLRSKGIAPIPAMKAMMPALSLAFFSKSSVGTLPVTMSTIEKNLDVKPEISRFVLPLCTSINMNGCAAFIFATVVYLMQNAGMSLSLPMMALWVVIATIAAIGNAGVPMGCFFLSASLLSSMQVPISLMGIILPFYGLIDMLETALNVWSDISVAKVVDQSQGLSEQEARDLAIDTLQLD